MSFSETLNVLGEWTMENLHVLIGGFVAIVVLSAIAYMTRQRRVSEMERLAAAAAAAASKSSSTNGTSSSKEHALQWDPPEHSYADRRGAVRRDGTLVRVVLGAPSFRNGVGEGFVLDRSTGGLRISVAAEIELGTVMQVRAVNAPESIGFVSVVVRSCRKSGEFFEVGCEFEKTPPWNVLLLFG